MSFLYGVSMGELKLSEKQEKVFLFPFQNKYKILLAGGATQSGKTWACWIAFVMHKMYNYNNEIFVVIGQTKTSAEQNVIYKHWNELINLCGYHLRFDRRVGLLTVSAIVKGKLVKNMFRVFGGGNTGDETKIVGATFADAFFDEATHITEAVYNEIYNARLSKNKLKARPILTFNPTSHSNWVKLKLVDKAEEKNIKVLTFFQEDNPSIDEKTRLYNIAMAKDSGVFYKRMYEALWCDAEGLIFPNFRFDLEPPMVVPSISEDGITAYWLSLDYGLDHPFVVGLWGYRHAEDKYYLLDCIYHSPKDDGDKDNEQYYQMICNLVGNRNIEHIIAPHDSKSLKNTIRNKGKFRIKDADNDVLNGIQDMMLAMNTRKVVFCDTPNNQKGFIEFGKYGWDSKSKDGKDTPIKLHDDWICMSRYFIFTKKIVKYI